MDLLGKLPLQLLLLVYVQVGPLNGVQNPIGDFRIVQIGDFIAPILIIEGHRCTVFHRPLEIVNRYVTAKGTLSNVVTGKQWSPGKANAGGGG